MTFNREAKILEFFQSERQKIFINEGSASIFEDFKIGFEVYSYLHLKARQLLVRLYYVAQFLSFDMRFWFIGISRCEIVCS